MRTTGYGAGGVAGYFDQMEAGVPGRVRAGR